jgi:ribonuclease VapC
VIVDTSAVLAILFDEQDAELFAAALDRATEPRMSVASYLEAAILIDRGGDPVASRRFDGLIAMLTIVLEPVTLEQAVIARNAFRDFGKGSGHPAKLNFGDCFSYALAKDKGQPLLFKGYDFTHTDVERVLG